MVRRQNRANQIRLRRGVNFVEMTLRFWQMHKLLDALVESAFTDHVGTRAKRGAHGLLVKRRPFSKRCGSAEIDLRIGHAWRIAFFLHARMKRASRFENAASPRLFTLQFPDQLRGCKLGFWLGRTVIWCNGTMYRLARRTNPIEDSGGDGRAPVPRFSLIGDY